MLTMNTMQRKSRLPISNVKQTPAKKLDMLRRLMDGSA